MAEILKGAPVTEALTERSKKEVEELKVKGVEPCEEVSDHQRKDEISASEVLKHFYGGLVCHVRYVL